MGIVMVVAARPVLVISVVAILWIIAGIIVVKVMMMVFLIQMIHEFRNDGGRLLRIGKRYK